MSPPDQPDQAASPPTHEDIERIRRIVQQAGPWSYAELVQVIGFLEGLPLEQLPPPVQGQVSEVLQALSARMNPLLQLHITTRLQRIETLRQKFGSSPPTGPETQGAG